MSAILAVLRREWEAYFRTPAGWLVTTLFLTLQGVVFWLFLRMLASPDAPPGGVMEFFFGGTMMFWIALALLATVAPMRLVAEELRSGTIEPLLTAPVSAGEVVIGKWLAAVAFFTTAWVPTLAYVVYLRASGASLDAGPIASGYLGTMLLGAAAMAVGLAASAVTRNQLVAAALSFVLFFVALLAGALEGQVRSPEIAAVIRRASLFRLMEDFGHGIVDSRQVVMLAVVTVVALLIATALLARLRGPLPVDAPRARRLPGWLTPILIGAIAAMTLYLSGRHYVRGDWTRESLYDLSPRTVAVLRALPRPVEATIFLYADRDSARAHAVAERTRAITGFLRELTQRLTRYAGGKFSAVEIDPDRDRQRAEGAMRRYGIGPYEMQQGVVVFTSGTRSQVVTWEDLVEPELDLDGEAGPALHAWRGEAAFLSAILTVTSDDPLRICFSAGHGEPDIESMQDGGYATFADELRRDGDLVRALERVGDAAATGCRVLVVAEPAQALSPSELAALRSFVGGGGRLLVMLGPVFARDGAAFARVGLEALAAEFGVTIGDNLVVDPTRASDVEGPSVWAAGPTSYRPHPLTTRFGGRLTYWPRTREVAPLDRPGPGLAVTTLVQTSPEGWGETDLATIRGEADLAFDSARDRKGPVSVAVAVERGGPHPTRLVFLGTGRLVMNYRLAGLMLRDYNADFVTSVISWLADRDARVGVGPKLVGRTAPALTAAQVSWAFGLFVVALPLLVLVAGGVTWGAAPAMKPRGLVVLAIVAVAMAAIIAIDRRGHDGGDESASARTRLLAPFDRQAVKRVTIARKGGAFSLLHSPSPSAPAPAPSWHLGVEGAPAADDAAVQDLLSALDLAESDRSAQLAPEQAGLVPPAAAVDVETPTGTLPLQLGSVDASGQGVYARAGANAPVRVVGRRVLDLVDRAPAAFRDRRLFPLDPTAVTAIAWRDENGGAHELRAVDGRWQNARKEWVDADRVVEALRRLFALRIDNFNHDNLNGDRTLALTAGAARVAVEGGERGSFVRGAEGVTVPPEDLQSAWRALAAAESSDTRLVAMPPESVTRIDLHDAHARVGLRRAGGAWTFSPPAPPYAADTNAVDEWLARLGTIKAPTRSGGANARHLLVEGRFRQEIDVSSPTDVHALLAPDPLRFRARDVLSFARFDVRRLQRSVGSVGSVGRHAQQLTTTDGGTWHASSGEPDAANAALVVGALSDLRAVEWIAAPPAGEPAVRLEVDVQRPGEPRPTRHVVQLYTRPNDCVARLDADTTFRLERATCATLRLDLLAK